MMSLCQDCLDQAPTPCEADCDGCAVYVDRCGDCSLQGGTCEPYCSKRSDNWQCPLA